MLEERNGVRERHDVILKLVLDKEFSNRVIGQDLAHAPSFERYGEVDELLKIYERDLAIGGEKLSDKANRMLEICDRKGIGMVFLGDPDYPPLLKEIQDPPALLFYRGNREVLTQPGISVVGARRATPYGKQVAYDIALAAAKAHFSVVSGMAIGIDGAAHKGALDAGGRTIGVMAGSLEMCYPKSHQWLFDQTIERGAVLSEYAPGNGPLKWHFVERNRIISGMSRVTVVAQAGVRSGSLITARYAAEQARDVYCVPGSVYDPEYLGSHRLIQDGANVLSSIRDLFTEEERFGQCALALPAEMKKGFPPRRESEPEENAWDQTKRRRKRSRSLAEIAGEWRWLYEAIDDFGTGVETLHKRTGKDPVTVQMGISELEILGLVEHSGSLIIKKQRQ